MNVNAEVFVEATADQGDPSVPRSRASRLRRSLAGGLLAAAIGIGALPLAGVQPALALSTITPPGGFYCNGQTAKLEVAPPRAWASANRPEPVLWVNQVQRWDGYRWAAYRTFANIASFDIFGRTAVTWRRYSTSTYWGSFINSRLNLGVSHRGYYRIYAVVGNDSLSWKGYIAGGAYCFIP